MNCKKSVLEGMLTGIGGMIYLSTESRVLSSRLFSLGLLAVIILVCNLYTGKFGYVKQKTDIATFAAMCVQNFIGAAAMGLAAYVLMKENGTAQGLADKKLAMSFTVVFIKAIMCGMMIYLVVELYKRSKQILLVVMPIMIFILCRFEHCVAYIFYFAAAGVLNLRVIIFILICVIGNAAGSLIVRMFQKYE